MNLNRVLEMGDVSLRDVVVADAEGAYGRWLHDPEVTRFLESRFSPPSPEALREFIATTTADPDHLFLAIVRRRDGRHVGNIKVGPIDWIHGSATLGLLIGEKDCWGQGYGTDAIRLARDYAFHDLNLRKLTAGCYSVNQASVRTFEKAGFQREGLRRSQYVCEGAYVDQVLFGALRDDDQAPLSP